MSSISAGDLTLLRARKGENKHTTIERLYAVGSPDMMIALVSAPQARGSRSITYNTGAMQGSYAFADLIAGVTVAIQTTQGTVRRRLRSISGTASSGTITIDWHDDIDATTGDSITIEHSFLPWPKYSYFTASGPTFRKDGPDGDTYTDENEDVTPLVLMGPHYANELPASGSLVVQLDASETNPGKSGATITTHLWSATPSAGVSFSATNIANPTVTFTTEGLRYLSYTATNSDSKSATGYRAYKIGDGITEFAHSPITTQFNSHSVKCSISSTSPDVGDSSAIRPQADWSDFVDGSLVLIAADDYYGTTQKTISARDTHADHQRMVYAGYIVRENDTINPDGSIGVELQCESVVDMYLYSLSVTGVLDPSDWFEMASEFMTVAGNLFHLFKYHSTLLDISDWHLPWSDTTKRSANEEFTQGGMLQKARALTRARLMGFTATPQGEVIIEEDINLKSSIDRSAVTTTLTLDADDIGTATAIRRARGDNVRVLVSGGKSDGVLNSYAPFFSTSHKVARAQGTPATIPIDNLMLSSQTEANFLAGRIADVANQRYEEINLTFSGGYRQVILPAPQQWTNLGTVFSAKHPRNADLANETVVPRQVTYSYDPVTGVASISTAVLEPEAFAGSTGLDGVTLTPPVVPSNNPADDTFDSPDPPAWPVTPPNEIVNGPAVVMDATNGIYWTTDTGSTWTARNGGLATANGRDLIWSPWWKTVYESNSSNPEMVVLWWLGTGYVRKSTDAGKTWTDITGNLGTPPNNLGDSPAPAATTVTYVKMHGNIHNFGYYTMAVEWENGSSEFRSWLVSTVNNWASATWRQI